MLQDWERSAQHTKKVELYHIVVNMEIEHIADCVRVNTCRAVIGTRQVFCATRRLEHTADSTLNLPGIRRKFACTRRKVQQVMKASINHAADWLGIPCTPGETYRNENHKLDSFTRQFGAMVTKYGAFSGTVDEMHVMKHSNILDNILSFSHHSLLPPS